MGTIPLVALGGKPPDIEPYEKMQADALGRRIGRADLQTKNLQNQELQTILRGNQAVVNAQHDQNWDPSDPDKVMKVLKQYSVPVPLQAQVMKNIEGIKTSLANGSKEELAQVADAHSYFDDQFQAVTNAPEDSKQKTYQQALTNARNHVALYQNGQAKQQAMQEIASAPPIYDENWIRGQHAQLRTQQFLTEDALKKSQTAEAAGKGQQAVAAGNLDTAKIPGAIAEGNLFQARIPGAEAESDIQQQQAAMNPQLKPELQMFLQGCEALLRILSRQQRQTRRSTGKNTRTRLPRPMT